MPGEPEAIRDGRTELWATGEVQYLDNNKTIRTTGFAWLYNDRF
jgi:hypothetical protein